LNDLSSDLSSVCNNHKSSISFINFFVISSRLQKRSISIFNAFKKSATMHVTFVLIRYHQLSARYWWRKDNPNIITVGEDQFYGKLRVQFRARAFAPFLLSLLRNCMADLPSLLSSRRLIFRIINLFFFFFLCVCRYPLSLSLLINLKLIP